MTDAEKQALINKLSGGSKSGFDARYSIDNRKWFVGKIIDSLISQNVPDSDIGQKTEDIIAAAGMAVKARVKGGPPPGGLAGKWDRFDQLKSRTQIIYGMIAMNPEFLDPANSGYFGFILERRSRAIWRMHFHVNPNKYRGEFGYPGSDKKMQVNKDCTLLWQAFLDKSIPFILTSSGKDNPVSADDTLFQREKDTDRNLFSCDPVATILHMDALHAAKDPGALLKALVANGDHYLKIDHPGGHCANSPDGQRLAAVSSAPVSAGEHKDIEVGNAGPILELIKDQLTPNILGIDNYIPFNHPNMKFMIVQGDVKDFFKIESVDPATRMVRADKLTHSYTAGARVYKFVIQFPFYDSLPFHFLTDDRPGQALFEQLMVKSTDLQVGDHIYVINHPLYRLYEPTGNWGGEHSFVTEISARDIGGKDFRNTLKVEGHGLDNRSLLNMSEDMLGRVNKILGVLQTLTRIHLANLQANGRATVTAVTPNGTFGVKFIARKEPDPDGKMIDMNVFEYTGKYTYSYLSQGKNVSGEDPAFVIKELASNPNAAFQVFSYEDTNSAVDPAHAPRPIRNVTFIGSDPAEQFKVSKWAATWFNTQTVRFEYLPLFGNDNKIPIWLSFDNLLITKPFFATDQKGDLFVTRPRVDFSSAYQTFLKSKGAF